MKLPSYVTSALDSMRQAQKKTSSAKDVDAAARKMIVVRKRSKKWFAALALAAVGVSVAGYSLYTGDLPRLPSSVIKTVQSFYTTLVRLSRRVPVPTATRWKRIEKAIRRQLQNTPTWIANSTVLIAMSKFRANVRSGNTTLDEIEDLVFSNT